MSKLKRKKLAEQSVAIHEAGHTIMYWMEAILPGVKLVSIIREGNSLGRTRLKKKRWIESMSSKDFIRAEISAYMGGRIAEILCLDEPFIGSRDDIQKATDLARTLVAEEGMQDEFGLVCLGQTAGSEHVRKQVDVAVTRILRACYAEAIKKLRKHKQAVFKVASALIDRKLLKTKDLKKILGPRPKWKPKHGLLRRVEKKGARRKK